MKCSMTFALTAVGIQLISAAAVIPPTKTPVSALRERAEDPIPTYTAGVPEAYVRENTPPLPSGSVIRLFPDGFHENIPVEGVDVAFGPDLERKLEETFGEKCSSEKLIGDCSTALTNALPQNDLKSHTKRVNPQLAILVPIIGYIWAMIMLANRKPPKVIHLSHKELGQLEGIGSATVVAIETGADHEVAGTLTFTAVATPTEAAHVSISIASADNGAIKKDDLVIDVPEPVATRFTDFLAMLGVADAVEKCKKGSAKRGIDRRVPPPDSLSEDCIQDILNFARAGFDSTPDVFAGLAPNNPNNPLNPGDGQFGGAAPNIRLNDEDVLVLLLRQHIMNRNIDEQQLAGTLMLGALVLNVVFFIITATHQAAPLVVNLNKNDLGTHSVDDIKCPKDLVCLNPDCDGEEVYGPFFGERKSYQTGYCLKKPNRFCPCEKVEESILHELDAGYIEAQYAFLQELIGIADSTLSGVEPECIKGGVPVKAKEEQYDRWVEAACKNHAELKKRDMTTGPSGIIKRDGWEYNGGDNDEGFKYSFRWKDDGECKFSCTDLFNTLKGTGDCISNNGITRGAAIFTGCGEASFYLNEYSPPPTDNPMTSFRAQITQEARVDGNSYIEWSLYNGPTIEKVEGPSRKLSFEAPSFLVEMVVDEPNDVDKTNIRFIVSSRIPDSEKRERFSVGTKANFYRDAIGIFPYAFCEDPRDKWENLPNGQGGKRTINCYFDLKYDNVFHDKCDERLVVCWNMGPPELRKWPF
ncbi:uncharacterized protein EI97DRAFT_498621 [Westerdykella ornata]|uniref:FAS1 domain-containing protein n=1 Tax=Westerdykella ornata TaxID=318751 RepID=A0A6A6JZG4_WESOR|nr:uncharacterized protein EI97DRAFT_498621 [Westerdykella ornata]KAF2280449.1 hypothetical protein EI97DRAFT_498621 [Westerdykella ornata]